MFKTEKENQNCAAEVYTFVEKNFFSETDELKHDVRYLLRINTFRLMIHAIVSKNLHAHHLSKRLIFSFNLGNLEGISSGEVLSTMTEEPAEKISEEVCLENAPLEEEIKLGTKNTDQSIKRVR